MAEQGKSLKEFEKVLVDNSLRNQNEFLKQRLKIADVRIDKLQNEILVLQKKADGKLNGIQCGVDELKEFHHSQATAKHVCIVGSIAGAAGFLAAFLTSNIGLGIVGLSLGAPAILGWWRISHEPK